MDVHNLPLKKGVKADDVYMRRRTKSFLVIECEGGYYTGGRGGGTAFDSDGKKVAAFQGTGGRDHALNFIEGMRNRKPEHLKGEIEEIHFSSAWCHLGNISWRLSQSYSRDQAEAAVKDFQPWNDVIADFHDHLQNNELEAGALDIQLGAMLEIDPAAETFVGDTATAEALALLTREYRAGFEVPDTV